MNIDLSIEPGTGYPLAVYDSIRAGGPISWCDNLGGWAVCSYEGVKTVLADADRFTTRGTPIADAFGAEAMLVTEAPLHDRMRNVWARHASRAAMAARSDQFRAIAARWLRPAGARLDAGETLDLCELFQDYVAEVVTCLFEIPPAGANDLKRWNRMFADTPALAQEEQSSSYSRHHSAKEEVYAFLNGVMAERRARLAAGEDLQDFIALMVAAVGTGGITHTNAIDNLMNFFLGALDTTTRWLGNTVVVLHRHRDSLAEVRSNRSCLSQALEEIMRLETVPQLLLRLVKTAGVELHGQPLQKNDVVYVLPGMANRDPALFARPGDFDIHRPARAHLGFGVGMHQCLGANAARQEVLAFIDVLLDELPDLEIVNCDYGDSWALWGPRNLSVRLP